MMMVMVTLMQPEKEDSSLVVLELAARKGNTSLDWICRFVEFAKFARFFNCLVLFICSTVHFCSPIWIKHWRHCDESADTARRSTTNKRYPLGCRSEALPELIRYDKCESKCEVSLMLMS